MGVLKRMMAAGAMVLTATASSVQANQGVGQRTADDCPPGDKQCAGAAAYANNELACTVTRPNAAETAAGVRGLASPAVQLSRGDEMKAPAHSFVASPDLGERVVDDASRDGSSEIVDVPATQVASLGERTPGMPTNALRALSSTGPALRHAGHFGTLRNPESL